MVLPDNVQIIYADISHKYSMNKALSYTVALQYDRGEDIGAGHAGVVVAKTWGVLTSVSYDDITLRAAYNKNDSHYAALASLGGGAFYTSMEDQTLDAITGGQAEAVLVALEYTGVKNMILGAAFGEFKAGNKSD